MRILLSIVLPFLLPTLFYAAWLFLTRRLEGIGWTSFPWPWLAGSGIALAALFLYVVNVHFGQAPQGTYVPPQWIDGKVVPGHLEPPKAGR